VRLAMIGAPASNAAAMHAESEFSCRYCSDIIAPGALSASILVALVAVAVLAAQAPMDPKLQNNLKRLSRPRRLLAKGGDPPHFKAFSGRRARPRVLDDGAAAVRAAYDGHQDPRRHDTKGILTGVVVVEHHEPYGNFSVDTAGFAAQFRGKSIPTRSSGVDVDAVSRATISITSSSRAIRNARALPRASFFRRRPRNDAVARGVRRRCRVRVCLAPRGVAAQAQPRRLSGNSTTKTTSADVDGDAALAGGRSRRVRRIHGAGARHFFARTKR